MNEGMLEHRSFGGLSAAAMVRVAALLLLASSVLAAPPLPSELEKGFGQPPAETRPWCYWYWLTGNISREGITKDLEAMARWGIGRAVIGDIHRGGMEPGPVEDLSEDYFSMIEHAVREGRRLGVDISLFNCPGWSQAGGPWVKPGQSMRHLVCTERRVSGPATFQDKLPAPEPRGQPGKPAPEDFLQDVAVLAFPAPRGESEHHAVRDVRMAAPARRAPPAQVDIAVPDSFTARSLTLQPPSREVEQDRTRAGAFDADCDLQAQNPDGTFETIRSFPYRRLSFSETTGPMPRGSVTVSFPARRAPQYRLVFRNLKLPKGVAETSLERIELSTAARLSHFVEQQLGKMSSQIQPPWDYYLWPSQPEPEEPGFCIDPALIVDLTDRVGPDGTLNWDAPAGEWVIVRVMMQPTGVKNRPASPAASGLEADKMNPVAMADHYRSYMGRVVARIPADDRPTLAGVVIDSYESGSQNWTDGAREDFQRAFGYDPVPWLPVLTGRLVGSADRSMRFLWDLRRFVADRIAHTYGTFAELGRRDGLALWLEPYGHYGFPAEFLQLASKADGVGGEFWLSPMHGDMEVQAAVSAAHIYGKRVVSAEAFTATGAYGFSQDPWSLKALGDLQQAKGVNHFVMHVYIHQPGERAPGMNAWFGTEFNRHNTWFERGAAWIAYLQRCHFLLQQGVPVADAAYFIGEDAPKMAGVRRPALPPGYRADDINGDVIRERLRVKDGRFVLPDGTSYRLLVLPPLDTMRPQTLEKLKELIEAGGAVLGPAPSRSPSMQDYPESDQRVRALAATIWSNQTRVFSGIETAEALHRLGIAPDVLDEGTNLVWMHRSHPEGEIYFLSNQSDAPVSATPSFRVSGRQPEWWDPVTGGRRVLPDFSGRDGRTSVPLELHPRQSGFVIFRNPAGPQGGRNFPRMRVAAEIPSPWTVSFDPARGGPETAVFEKLVDWTARPEPGIRNYSGAAVYRNQFDLPALARGRRLYLDLGALRSLATVRLNGHDLGVVWCAPWRADITSAAREKGNKLEIEVINPWINRLLADQQAPSEQQITWTAIRAVIGRTPVPSGLLGPVTIQVEEESPLAKENDEP